jgi:hypothetical protein
MEETQIQVGMIMGFGSVELQAWIARRGPDQPESYPEFLAGLKKLIYVAARRVYDAFTIFGQPYLGTRRFWEPIEEQA